MIQVDHPECKKIAMSDSKINDVARELEVMLTDCWHVGNSQFCITKEYKSLQEFIGDSKFVYASVTPDVGIEKNPKFGYSWST